MKEDLSGIVYRSFLAFSAKYCERFLLVMRPTFGLNAKAQKALNALSPFILESDEMSSWPGTDLLGGVAKVNEYSFQQESLEVILRLSSGLYEWEQPDLPEDFGLLRRDRSPFLASIAHEKDAYLNLTSTEYEELRSAIPDIRVKADLM